MAECYAFTEEECSNSIGNLQWCPPPAEPADEGISEAIITVIVFMSLIFITLTAGAYSVCRGAARS